MKEFKNVALPKEKHKKLKIKAARDGKKMGDYVVEKCEL